MCYDVFSQRDHGSASCFGAHGLEDVEEDSDDVDVQNECSEEGVVQRASSFSVCDPLRIYHKDYSSYYAAKYCIEGVKSAAHCEGKTDSEDDEADDDNQNYGYAGREVSFNHKGIEGQGEDQEPSENCSLNDKGGPICPGIEGGAEADDIGEGQDDDCQKDKFEALPMFVYPLSSADHDNNCQSHGNSQKHIEAPEILYLERVEVVGIVGDEAEADCYPEHY